VPGRFIAHDLLRAYTAEQARIRCSDQERTSAARRMLDYYLHSAQAAARLMYGPWDQLELADARPGVTPEQFADEAQAAAWLHAEYQVLLGCIEHAAATGFERHAWQLARTMASYFERRGHWRDWTRVQRVALLAAERIGDPAGTAHANHQLGNALIHVGGYEQAHQALLRALALFRSLGDDAHRAQVHMCIGYLADCRGSDQQAFEQGDHHSARHLWRQALRLHEASDYPDAAAIRQRLARV
jgi:tetratricopeptide (TPR) repeat protein